MPHRPRAPRPLTRRAGALLGQTALTLCLLVSAALTARAETGAGASTGDAITHADEHPGEWLGHGRTWSEQRYSPLDAINVHNVGSLHLAWHLDLDTNRGQEGSPIIEGGVMYETTAWSMVKAVDAATGKLLWSYDPKVVRTFADKGCCDVVNRGPALWNDKIYVATYDNRLIALDKHDGHVVWSVDTIPHDADLGSQRSYTITGAPLAAKGQIVIGNGGAELGARGFISAFNAETGKLSWRFYTVPNAHNAPDHAASDDVLRKVAYPTWSKGGAWLTQGGGGTAWDSIVYDPVTNLIYIGTGNGSPWSYLLRSEGKGDNLFLSSIIAVKPDTGEYVWHFQETPKDQWDYTSVQHIMTLDLPINGAMRHVIAHAPKNGFFYILDAKTGEFLSGKNFVYVNWAKGLDPKTGRPLFTPDALYSTKGNLWYGFPGTMGAHGVPEMAYSPRTGYVYIPVQQAPDFYQTAHTMEVHPDAWNLGEETDASDARDSYQSLAKITKDLRGWLVAWDPVRQRAAWRTPEGTDPINGGLLATAGDVVFQGLANGQFHAFDARSGKDLFSFDAQSGILAPPVSYLANGKQYVAVEVGWGGGYGLYPSGLERRKLGSANHSRILAFTLDGTDSLPPAQIVPLPPLSPPHDYDRKSALAGSRQFALYCQWCHGNLAQSNGVLPDLRYSSAIADKSAFESIVGKGALEAFGMDRFDKSLSPEEIETIRQYLIWRAHQTLEEQAAKSQKPAH
ncbi:PQQ-dependent dehydrogenase, methanol/ethanol family [Acetobacter sp. DsW_063]|uniref:PQQ-dependent dehydrogenase, methanol/ethanol family n=1 Tax=Acetobacter sp. DsW_063 TaxID=1514894 RepID=UPI000A3B5296|nr:PQQ-dependent dehydrogenase, methanol/ethanol family [Acetobacter sp. DsW_063]